MSEHFQSIASCSAVGIEVPDFPTFFPATVSPDEREAQLDRLRAMKRSCEAKGDNRNECVITLVWCCLDDGTDTIGGIVSLLGKSGCDRKHVAALTRACTGSNPARHFWSSDAEGRLTAHSGAI